MRHLRYVARQWTPEDAEAVAWFTLAAVVVAALMFLLVALTGFGLRPLAWVAGVIT